MHQVHKKQIIYAIKHINANVNDDVSYFAVLFGYKKNTNFVIS